MRIVWFQQVGDRRHIIHSGIEPEVVAVGIENHRHPIVDGSGHFIWNRREDRTRLDPLPFGVLPPVPDSREREQLAFIYFKAERLLGRACSLPFIEAICGDQTSAESQRIAKCGLGSCRLRFRVDRTRRNRRFFCPVRNQTPAHGRGLADRFCRVLADYGDRLRRSNIETRRPVVIPRRSIEILLDDLLSPRESVATAHGEKLSQTNSLQAKFRNFNAYIELQSICSEMTSRGALRALQALATTKVFYFSKFSVPRNHPN